MGFISVILIHFIPLFDCFHICRQVHLNFNCGSFVQNKERIVQDRSTAMPSLMLTRFLDLHFLYGDIWRCFDFSLVESRHTESRCKPYLRILQPGSCRNADDFGTDGAAGRLGSCRRYLHGHIGCRHRSTDKTNGAEWESWAKANHHRSRPSQLNFLRSFKCLSMPAALIIT